MGLFAYTLAGGGFVVVGAWEFFLSSTQLVSGRSFAESNPVSPAAKHSSILQLSNRTQNLMSSPPLFTYSFSACFSAIFLINSLISISSAVKTNDSIGPSLQFQVLAVALLFLLYSFLGLISKLSNLVNFPSEILNLVVLFGFMEEFLLFYLQKKDTSGIENRYYDLMLLPISICIFSTIFQLKSTPISSLLPKMARGIGLILQGMWFLQMGVSFYSSWISTGCNLTEKSRGNFTIKCRGHMEYHRARGIATLLFNCHLAFLVAAFSVAYALIVNKSEEQMRSVSYKPLRQEANRSTESGQAFSIYSDDDGDDEIRELGRDANKPKGGAVELSTNGIRLQQ